MKFLKRMFFVGILFALSLGILTARNNDNSHRLASHNLVVKTNPNEPAMVESASMPAVVADPMPAIAFPDYLDEATEYVLTAYTYAATHPEDLEYQPCYCGCSRMGHKNNLQCYIVDGAGLATESIAFDQHASVCGVCIDITHDVIRLKDEGKTPKEIRAYIDAQYAKFGPSTDTPLPPF